MCARARLHESHIQTDFQHNASSNKTASDLVVIRLSRNNQLWSNHLNWSHNKVKHAFLAIGRKKKSTTLPPSWVIHPQKGAALWFDNGFTGRQIGYRTDVIQRIDEKKCINEREKLKENMNGLAFGDIISLLISNLCATFCRKQNLMWS